MRLERFSKIHKQNTYIYKENMQSLRPKTASNSINKARNLTSSFLFNTNRLSIRNFSSVRIYEGSLFSSSAKFMLIYSSKFLEFLAGAVDIFSVPYTTVTLTYSCGNKMPTRCNRSFFCRSYCLLNMFRASLCPSSGAQEYYSVVAACGISCCGFFK